MVKALYYPPANKTVQNFGKGNVTMPKIEKLVLHTTETSGWPGYGGSGGHPTLTYNPWSHQWRQHLPINGSATALVDPSGTAVRENRDGVVQLEIVCYCDLNTAKKYGHSVEAIDNTALHDIAEFIVWLHKEWAMSTHFAAHWAKYPASINVDRFSGAEFDAFKGVLGHCHVSGNTHGDPGSLDVKKIQSYVNTLLTPPKPVVPPDNGGDVATKPARPKYSADTNPVMWDGIDAPEDPAWIAKQPKPNWFWTLASYARNTYVNLSTVLNKVNTLGVRVDANSKKLDEILAQLKTKT